MAPSGTGIAIFVKTPGISPVKTRLAATEGVEYAENWYRRAAAAVAEVAQLSGAKVYWAVAEPEAMNAAPWQNLPRLSQMQSPSTRDFASVNTNLGARMHRVQQQLLARHQAAILLGADTPHLDVRVLLGVIDYLQTGTPSWAAAPALDGGFWLHGANRSAPLTAWEAVRYSCADTMAQFELAMANQGNLTRFQTETDVDTAADLAACVIALAKLPQATNKQRALLRWMRAQGGSEGSQTLENPQTNG